MNEPKEVDIYDVMAPHYREYSEKRSVYLRAVDQYVMDHFPAGARSLLDVGAGDGVRAATIARQKGVPEIVLCDPSQEMVALCRKLNPAEVWHASAEQLPPGESRFDIVTCLWNVMGHVSSRSARVASLRNISRLAKKDARIFLDVNNRHNATAYGWKQVALRVIVDMLCPDDRRGDTTYTWQVGGKTVPGRGHLFTPAEIEGIIRDSGLRVLERVSIDYATGSISKSRLRGQLVYMLGKGEAQ